MDLHAARQLALDLMKQHGLSGWTFSFDRARRRFGACRAQTQRITLSTMLTFMNGPEQVRETILHEIAHALTPGGGHGAKWRAKCLEIGAKPERCYGEEEVQSPPRRPAPYVVGCKACGWWADRHKLSRRRLVCRACRGPVVFREKMSGAEVVVVRGGA